MKSYIKKTDDRIIIGNDLIERSIRIGDGYPVSEYILDKKKNKYWCDDNTTAMCNICGFEFGGDPEFILEETDNDGLSERHLVGSLIWNDSNLKLRQSFEVYDDSPFVSCFMFAKGCSKTEETVSDSDVASTGIESDVILEKKSAKLPSLDTIDYLPLSNHHLKVESIVLVDKTDDNDNYVVSQKSEIYVNKHTRLDGNLFLLDDKGEGLMLVKEAPCVSSQLSRTQSDFSVRPRKGGYAAIVGSGLTAEEICDEELPLYGSSVGIGGTAELKRLYRRHYGKVFLGIGNLFAMSNTWGDRSRDVALCEEFMLRERECAEKIGVDIMQFDDGWQKGISANSGFKKDKAVWSNGYYRSDPAFWDVNVSKFPSGLTPIMSDKLELALWFSADAEDSYAAHSRDAKHLSTLSREYGINQFKLDGMRLNGKLSEKHIIDFLEETHSLCGATFNLDITAQVRLGYLPHKEIGTLFVENRYTDFTNYYPHAVLKNLWMLSELFPTRKFQFELLNNTRNADKYEAIAPGDPLAPINYDIDWLFASVMVANPLVWMEMQHLPPAQLERLSKIVAVWKEHRSRLYSAEIDPIGQQPDGYVFTGFKAAVSDDEGYLIMLRESGSETDFSLNIGDGFKYELIASSEGVSLDGTSGITVHFDNPRSYSFIHYYK